MLSVILTHFTTSIVHFISGRFMVTSFPLRRRMNGCVINTQARILQRTESVFLTIIIFLSLKKNECAVSDHNLFYDNSHIFVFDRKMFSEMIRSMSTVFDTLISTSFQY